MFGANPNPKNSLQSFLPVGLCVDESVPISVPRFSIPVWREAGLGLGLCVELVLPMPSAVGSPPTPCVDGAAVSAAEDKSHCRWSDVAMHHTLLLNEFA